MHTTNLRTLWSQGEALEAASALEELIPTMRRDLEKLPYKQLRDRCQDPRLREMCTSLREGTLWLRHKCKEIWESRAREFKEPFYPTDLPPEERYLQLATKHGRYEPGSERYLFFLTGCILQAIHSKNLNNLEYFVPLLRPHEYINAVLWALDPRSLGNRDVVALLARLNANLYREALAIRYALAGNIDAAQIVGKPSHDLVMATIAGGNLELLAALYRSFGDKIWYGDSPQAFLLQARAYDKPELYQYLVGLIGEPNNDIDHVRYHRYGNSEDYNFIQSLYWRNRRTPRLAWT